MCGSVCSTGKEVAWSDPDADRASEAGRYNNMSRIPQFLRVLWKLLARDPPFDKLDVSSSRGPESSTTPSSHKRKHLDQPDKSRCLMRSAHATIDKRQEKLQSRIDQTTLDGGHSSCLRGHNRGLYSDDNPVFSNLRHICDIHLGLIGEPKHSP